MSVPYALYAESSGTPGPEGPDGEPGNNGVNCWDSNSNGLNDIEEDINDDGEYNALDCMWVLSNASSSPLGVILPYAASNTPEGWMICDGTELSRDEYSDLFSLIDTTYGSGDGFSTFNIPNLSGRVPVGKDVDSTIISNGAALGNFGGEETHTLTADEIASLSIHSSDGPQSNWSGGAVPLYNMPKISSASFDGGMGYPGGVGWTSLVTNAGDQAHNNMQPYLITNYIMRVVTESNTYIDGVSQIPPVEEILELQYKVDSLEEVFSSDIFSGFTKIEANESDSITISAIPGRDILLTGQINGYLSCWFHLDINFEDESYNVNDNIKGGGWMMPILDGSSISPSQHFQPLYELPFTSGYWDKKFYYRFHVSHPMDITIFTNNPECGAINYLIQY
jgi:microcystin-dependent protein